MTDYLTGGGCVPLELTRAAIDYLADKLPLPPNV
jgi:hypothetical protein